MSTPVTLLTAANVADSGVGDPVDVSALGTLRLDWTVKTNHGKSPQIEISIETSPVAATTGPWTQVWRRLMCAEKAGTTTEMDNTGWHTQPRALIAAPDRFVRAKWSGVARANVSINNTSAEFNIACAGEGI